MRRILGWTLLLLLLLIAVAAVIALYVVRSPFPKVDGSIDVAGLRDEVVIRRDEWGMPHIYANNEHDLFFAQGYTHAQDRFWQMEFWRHTGQGRLSEIVGPATLETDKFIRNIGWNRIAVDTAAYYEANDPQMWAIMEAYSAGVNSWLAENRDDISVNQRILGLSAGAWEIEDWQPLDTIGWGIVMAWDLRGSSNMHAELERMRADLLLPQAVEDAVFPLYPDDRPLIVPPPYAAPSEQQSAVPRSPALDRALLDLDLIGSAPPDGFLIGSGPLSGSNNWVVHGEHTATGLPLLADDPHLGVQMPSIWYLNGLHAPGWDVAGFSFAGVPGVVVGHNDRIAWGVTNMGADSQDLFIEKLNPNDPNQYEFDGEWRTMEVVRERIDINGEDPLFLDVRLTQHGPLLNNLDAELTQALSMRWTAFEPSRIFRAIIMLNQAQDYAQFREALSYWDTSPQNVVYADIDNNIAYQATGRYPLRNGWTGVMPLPGWTGEFEWGAFIPYDDLPRLFNPASGYIVTANNAIVDQSYPYYLTLYWADGNRAQRIVTMLEEAIARGNVSAETFATMHSDSHELLFDAFLPLLRDLRSDDAQVQVALERMRGWDGQLRTDSVGAALFERFLFELSRTAAADELGAMSDDLLGNGNSTRVLLKQMAADRNHFMWDNTQTPMRESAEETIVDAIRQTVDWYDQHLGGDTNAWTWGEVHTITFRSDPLGQSGISAIERLVNRGPFAVDGGASIVNATGFPWNDSFAEVTANPSMRMIIDLAEFDNSQVIHPTGQSGHPFHPHYDDLIPLWLRGDYIPLLYSAETVRAATVDTLTLSAGGD